MWNGRDEMNARNQNLLGEMDVRKALIKLSIPATIGMIVNALYNLVDTLFVSWGAGETAIGGLTLAFPLQMIVVAVALMIGIGGASVFSRAYGAKNQEKMDVTINTALRFGIIVAVSIAVLGSIFLEPLLEFFGASETNIGYGKDYLSIILIGITFQSVSMILNNFTRAEGRAKVAMIALSIGAGLNILLDPLFIFDSIDFGLFTLPTLGLGVKGAAMATVTSQLIAFLYIVKKSFAEESVLRIKRISFFQIDQANLKEIITIGLPTFLRNAIGAILSIVVLKTISIYAGSFVNEYTSIYGIVNRVLFFLFMPGFGLVQGLAPIAGYNYGAKSYERLVEVVKFAMIIMILYFIVAFTIAQKSAPFIFDLFSKNNDTFIIETGTRVFQIVTLGLVFISFQIVIGAIYQAFGYAFRATIVSLLRQFILFVPISLILTKIYGLDGLWYTFFISDAIAGIISLNMFGYELKILKQKAQQI